MFHSVALVFLEDHRDHLLCFGIKMLWGIAYSFVEVLFIVICHILLFSYTGKTNVLESGLWSVYTGESKTYM